MRLMLLVQDGVHPASTGPITMYLIYPAKLLLPMNVSEVESRSIRCGASNTEESTPKTDDRCRSPAISINEERVLKQCLSISTNCGITSVRTVTCGPVIK